MKSKLDKLIDKLKDKTITDSELNYIISILKKSERERIVEARRIKGAIKQFLHSHPRLTMELVGSLVKRIQGSLIAPPKKKETIIDKIKKWLN